VKELTARGPTFGEIKGRGRGKETEKIRKGREDKMGWGEQTGNLLQLP